MRGSAPVEAPIYFALVHAWDYREIKHAVAPAEEWGIPEAKRKARWGKAAGAIAALDTH